MAPRQATEAVRDQLLASATKYVYANGIDTLTLRQMAPELGTSHRMLVYYFGSKEALLGEIIRGAYGLVAPESPSDALSPREYGRQLWRQLTEPSQRDASILALETFVRSIRGAADDQLIAVQRERIMRLQSGFLRQLGTRYGIPDAVAGAWQWFADAALSGLLTAHWLTGPAARAEVCWELLLDLYEQWSDRYRRTGEVLAGWTDFVLPEIGSWPAETVPSVRRLEPGGRNRITRPQLLDLVMDYVGRHGMGGVSLRQLAQEIGTTHRVLIYHFGSKDELFAAMVAEVVRRVGQLFADEAPTVGGGRRPSASFWDAYKRSVLMSHFPLLGELVIQAMRDDQRRTAAERLAGEWVDGVVGIETILPGMSTELHRDFVQLGLAVDWGICYLHRLTGERTMIDAAITMMVDSMSLLAAQYADASESI